jgi:hypothetical protein
MGSQSHSCAAHETAIFPLPTPHKRSRARRFRQKPQSRDTPNLALGAISIFGGTQLAPGATLEMWP